MDNHTSGSVTEVKKKFQGDNNLWKKKTLMIIDRTVLGNWNTKWRVEVVQKVLK